MRRRRRFPEQTVNIWLVSAWRRLGCVIFFAAIVGGGAVIAPASPIVTFTLSINDDGAGNYVPGEFAVYASDKLDNGGIAGAGLTLGGNWTSNSVVAPFANYESLDSNGVFEGQFNIRGFTAISFSNDNPVYLYQSDITSPTGNVSGLPPYAHSEPVYGFGQAPGSLPPNPTFYAEPSHSQLNYGDPLLVLEGTFDGSVDLIGGDFTNANTFVFVDSNSVNTEPVSVEFSTQTLPEPTAGLAFIAGAFLLVRAPRLR